MKLTQVPSNEFQPNRLAQARLVKKWTQPELAERVGISRQMISSYEKAKPSGSTPSPENLRNLAHWLEVPEAYFYAPLRESETKLESAINFRTLKSKKRRARQQAETFMQWLVSVYDFVADYIELPPVQIPEFKIADFTKITMEQIEEIAEETRRYFGLGDGPISNVTKLLENKGVIIGRVPLETGMDGVSAWFNGRPVILINNTAYHARSRFDLGHELFHLIAHRDVSPEDLEDAETLRLIESQAHRFSGAFLAPYKTFLPEVVTIDLPGLIDLKSRWGLSAQAIVSRLYDLGVISEHQKSRMFTKVTVEGWRKKEPLDGSTEPEKAAFLDKVAEFFESNNIFSPNEFVVRSRIPASFLSLVSDFPKRRPVHQENVIAWRPR